MSEVRRGRGRPRISDARRIILDAAIDVLVESTYSSFTIDRVAAVAKVGRATVYRHWPSKQLLLEAALRYLRDAFVMLDSGDLEADLRLLLQPFVLDATPSTERVIATLASESLNDPELARIVNEELVLPRRQQVAEAFERALVRGEIRDDVNAALLVDATWGFIWHRRLITNLGLNEASVDAFLRYLVSGIRVRKSATPGKRVSPMKR